MVVTRVNIKNLKLVLFMITAMLSAKVLSKDTTCDKYSAYESDNALKDISVIQGLERNDQQLGATRDQDSTGYCYAYAAADMLEGWLKKKGSLRPSQSISAVGLGLNYHKDDWKKNTADFHSLAIKRELLRPRIDGIKSNIEELDAKEDTVRQKIQNIRDEFTGRHPKNAELLKLRKPNEQDRVDRGKSKSFDKKDERDNYRKRVDDFYNLDNEIWQDVENNPLFQEKISDLKKEKDHLSKESSHYNDLMWNLKEKLSPEKEMVPEGGFSKDAISRAWPMICLETEVNSRDDDIKKIYDEHRKLFEQAIYRPDNLQGVMGYLALNQFSGDNNNCAAFYVAKSMFPSLPYKNPNDFHQFLSKLKVYDNLFDILLKKSCSEKKYTPRPIFKTEEIQSRLPLGDNSKVFNLIDKSLKEGNTAAVVYRSRLFDHENLEQDDKDYHASTIVGSMKICGEPFYVLRNSWGKESCRLKYEYFRYSGSKKSIEENLYVKKLECRSSARVEVRKKFPKCESDDCHEKRDALSSLLRSRCNKNYLKKRNRELDHPFFCDPQGNYVIRKSFLEKAVYRATTISN